MVDKDKIEGWIRQRRHYLAFLHAPVEKDQETALVDFRSVGSMRY